MPNTFKNAAGTMFQLGGGPLAWGGGTGMPSTTASMAMQGLAHDPGYGERSHGPQVGRQSFQTGGGVGMRRQAMRGLRGAMGRR